VLRLPGSGLLGSQVPTGDGGLATLGADGVLRVVNLADGRIRWAHFAGRWPGLAAGGGRVMFGMGGRLTGDDASTGQVRWRLFGTGRPAWRSGMPTFVQAPPIPAAGCLLIQPADPSYACALTG
jgi:hypothetical protein